MKRKILSLMLAAALVLGLAVPALAAGQTFSDVPSSYWGYADIEAVAEAGLMKGTGGNQFSPEVKVSVAQFLTLLGRLVFPDVKTEGADWYGPYVSAAQEAKLLDGTQVDTNNVEAEISRYDMAVILRAAAKKLGVAEKSAQSSEVKDYLDIPTRYADSVLAVYGMGLIKGDQAGNFNGSNTMMRAEVATVIMRLAKAKPGSSTVTPGTEPEKPAEMAYTLKVEGGYGANSVLVPGERVIISFSVEPSSAAPYGDDRTGFIYTSSDPSVLEITGKASNVYDNWYVTARREGTATITVTDPCGVTGSREFNVVSARENLGAKTFTLEVRTAVQEVHSLRGNAYTENTFLYDVPYKIYYTRDGGKTSQLIHEGITPGTAGHFDSEKVTVELPEDSSYSTDAGFYISAETMLDGQRLVTSDLRTDGRACVALVPMGYSKDQFVLEPKLTLPTGEKARFTFKGAVGYGGNNGPTVGAGFVVRLYLKDGRLVAETTTDSTGHFSMDCEVDALDNGFNPDVDQYYVTASGIQNGIYMEENGKRPNGELRLWSLNFIGANPYNPSGMPISVK